ncbi:protein phosphatase 2C domain-containing protein [Streptomyces sp. WMMC500]|uniref:protein phosphatase 2C domain-containing protein n=1 Tax=Streptomyces sp. WMMC500 TaxID=3015154 RepID=UPI00248CDDAE|nr:protein phosphatase 2C domain-containing protein [Streptomyces sp. WMMC500]WBB62217.1 protein phosphatase 2C domain-containing protein [Streptomyces sp. WMMC500]
MDRQGETAGDRRTEDEWWHDLYEEGVPDTGPQRAGDTLDDRFASVARTVDEEADPAPPAPPGAAKAPRAVRRPAAEPYDQMSDPDYPPPPASGASAPSVAGVPGFTEREETSPAPSRGWADDVFAGLREDRWEPADRDPRAPGDRSTADAPSPGREESVEPAAGEERAPWEGRESGTAQESLGASPDAAAGAPAEAAPPRETEAADPAPTASRRAVEPAPEDGASSGSRDDVAAAPAEADGSPGQGEAVASASADDVPPDPWEPAEPVPADRALAGAPERVEPAPEDAASADPWDAAADAVWPEPATEEPAEPAPAEAGRTRPRAGGEPAPADTALPGSADAGGPAPAEAAPPTSREPAEPAPSAPPESPAPAPASAAPEAPTRRTAPPSPEAAEPTPAGPAAPVPGRPAPAPPAAAGPEDPDPPPATMRLRQVSVTETLTDADWARRGGDFVGAGPPTYEAEPTALPEVAPGALHELVPDTVLDGARYGSFTLRTAATRGDSPRYRGEQRRDALLTARFGGGDDALVLVAVATGARGVARTDRAADSLVRWMGEAVGRSRARLSEDVRTGRRAALKGGLHRLIGRTYGLMRAQAEEFGVDPAGYTAGLRCLLLSSDPACRTRVFFGTGPGGFFRLRDGEWQDLEPATPEEESRPAEPGQEEAAPADPRLTVDLGGRPQRPAPAGPPPPGFGALVDTPDPGEPAPFAFRASEGRPGDVLLLCSPGFAEPLRGAPGLAAELAERWRGQEAPPGLAAFLADVQLRAKGFADDRTAAALWES